MSRRNDSQLKKALEAQFEEYHVRENLRTDPLEYVHRYSDPMDQEAVGLCAALLAYGKVNQIRRSVDELLKRINTVSSSPQDFVRKIANETWKENRPVFRGFVHRFNSGKDMFALMKLLSRTWEEHESLGAYFNQLSAQQDSVDVGLNALIGTWKSWVSDRKWLTTRADDSVQFLLNAPENGSCCKRWCMYFKWMIRKDDIDVGTWSEFENLNPSQLVIPVDTHIARVSRELKLTQKKTMNWKTAIEITENLNKLSPGDPTRYDFALTRPGILKRFQEEAP